MTALILSSVAVLLCGSIPLQLHLDTGLTRDANELERLTVPLPPQRAELTPLPARVRGATIDAATAALASDDGPPLELVEAVAASWWMRPHHTYTPELWAATSQYTETITRTLGGKPGRHRASWWRRAYRVARAQLRVIEPQASFVRWGRRVSAA